jgi:hypothetical protein
MPEELPVVTYQTYLLQPSVNLPVEVSVHYGVTRRSP